MPFYLKPTCQLSLIVKDISFLDSNLMLRQIYYFKLLISKMMNQ